MTSWSDRINNFSGKTRYVVCRIFVHLNGQEVVPLLGTLNQAAREAEAAEGEIKVLGEGLATICQNLIQLSNHWQSAGNEGDVFWQETEAGDYIEELFTDSAQRYLSEPNLGQTLTEEELLSLPITKNLIVMLTIACKGEVPELETNLADFEALEAALQKITNLHYQESLLAIQIHFSPAQIGDELTDDQLLLNFPELIPL